MSCCFTKHGQKKPPKWIKKLRFFSRASGAEGGDAEASVLPATGYLYGYDNKETHLAWRATSLDGAKEVSKPIRVPKGANDDDMIVAEWADGHRASLADLRVKDIKDSKDMGTEVLVTLCSRFAVLKDPLLELEKLCGKIARMHKAAIAK